MPRPRSTKLGTPTLDVGVPALKVLGNVVVAPDVRRAVHRALYAEVNAQQLATARSFGRPIQFIAPDEVQDPKRVDDAWELWKSEVVDEL